jgi:hypothetical protein
MIPHTLTATARVEPTCTAAGNIAYWTCGVCKKLFSDANGTAEITQAETVIKATGHTLTKTAAKAATCTEEGNIDYWTCDTCHLTFSDEGGTTKIAVADTKVAKIAHTPEAIPAKDATCTATGLTEGSKCSVCNTILKEQEETPKIDHQLELVAEKDATCTEPGYKAYYKCKNCTTLFSDAAGKNVIDAATVIPATGHSMTETAAKAATCTAEGNNAYWNCSKCGKNFKDAEGKEEATNITIAALGHNKTAHAAQAATCTEKGNIAYWTCDRCNKTFSDESCTTVVEKTETDVLGHSTTLIAEEPATCTADGHKAYYLCSRCNKKFSATDGTTSVTDAELTIDKLGHDLKKVDAVAASCETKTNGNEAYWKCSRGDALFSDATGTTEISAIPTIAWAHTEVITNVKNPTCTEKGYTGDTVCSVCKQTITEGQEIPANDHKVTPNGYVAATCTTAGQTGTGTCDVCGEIITENKVISALGHQEETIPAVAATCTKAGSTAGVKCTRCGEILTATQEVPALGHQEETIPAVAATCTKAGSTAGVKCARCGEILTAPTATAATGHDWDNGKVTKEATYSAEGVKTYTCKNCGETKTESIDQLELAFPDLAEGAWYTSCVSKMVDAGLLVGDESGNFKPDDPLTRAQTAIILYRWAGEPAVSGTLPFSDTSDEAWYSDAVLWAYQQGVIQGDPSGTFRPNDPVAREELAIMMWRAAGKPEVSDNLGKFQDVNTYEEATKALRWAVQQGIMEGDADTATLRPGDASKRSEGAKMISVYLGL